MQYQWSVWTNWSVELNSVYICNWVCPPCKTVPAVAALWRSDPVNGLGSQLMHGIAVQGEKKRKSLKRSWLKRAWCEGEREGVIWQTCQAGLWQPSAVTFHYRSYWIQLPHKPGEMAGRKDAAIYFCKVRSLRRSAVTTADVWCDRMTEWHLGDFTSTSLVFVDEKISNAWRHTVVLVVWAQKSQMGE